MAPPEALEQRGLTDGQLDGIGLGCRQGLHGSCKILNPGQEAAFAKESVVNGNVQAASGFWIKEPA